MSVADIVGIIIIGVFVVIGMIIASIGMTNVSVMLMTVMTLGGACVGAAAAFGALTRRAALKGIRPDKNARDVTQQSYTDAVAGHWRKMVGSL